jgi:hypothetical protein
VSSPHFCSSGWSARRWRQPPHRKIISWSAASSSSRLSPPLSLSLSLSGHGGEGRERDSAVSARSGGSKGALVPARLRHAGRWLPRPSSSLPVPPACRGGEGRWRWAERHGESTLILQVLPLLLWNLARRLCPPGRPWRRGGGQGRTGGDWS